MLNINGINDKRTPLSPNKMNILGRKRYSGDSNACDVIEYSLDDCWRAIGRLYAVIAVISILVLIKPISLCFPKKTEWIGKLQ